MTKRVAIMQPYFLPYVGYFQLINSVDQFVIYDDIKYTKKGWINRNRFLLNGSDSLFSIPISKASDSLNVNKRTISETFDRAKLFNQFRGAYAKAPHYTEVAELIEKIVYFPDGNLFEYIKNSVIQVCNYLEIKTPIITSSDLDVGTNLKSETKVLAICKALGATEYVNPVGGIELYKQNTFESQNINLYFLKSDYFEYEQFKHNFVPWLSIIDVLMFNNTLVVRDKIQNGFELTQGERE